MSELQVTYWRELPSMVTAREGEHQVKAMLDSRFQEAIDEAAMRLGDVGADDYLMGWRRSDWESREGSADEVVAQCVAELEEAWSVSRIAEFLDGLG